MTHIEKKIALCLEELGFVFDTDESDDLQLTDYIDDSLLFVQFIVSLEDEFSIEFPDSYLLRERIGTLKDLALTVEELLSRK